MTKSPVARKDTRHSLPIPTLELIDRLMPGLNREQQLEELINEGLHSRHYGHPAALRCMLDWFVRTLRNADGNSLPAVVAACIDHYDTIRAAGILPPGLETAELPPVPSALRSNEEQRAALEEFVEEPATG